MDCEEHWFLPFPFCFSSINAINNELKELQFKYKTLKSELMYKTEESQIVQLVEPMGLKISKDMPERIKQ